MSDEELKQQIIEFVRNSKKKIGAREIADGIGVDHRTAKKALTELVNAGTLEFESFGGATFIKLGEGV
jgi:Mn-dependent DtxR family transcriptional regulator